MRTNVYVDGFNLYYGCLQGTPYKWLDLDALCRRLLPRDDIHRIRYFTARVKPRPHDLQQPQRQQIYHRALKTIPHLTIHYGHFLEQDKWRKRVNPPPLAKKWVEVREPEEKGSDVNLATLLLLDGMPPRDCQAAVLITNDSDLKMPVEMAQSRLKLVVGVINPHPPRKRSRALRPTFFKQIRESTLRDCQFPAIVSDEKGEIHKPPKW